MSRLHALLPLPVAQPQDNASPPAELMDDSPRWTRRAKRRIRPVRVMTGLVGDLPILKLQDPADAQGVKVYDCRPPLLPVSLQLCDLGPLSTRQTELSASVAVPPWKDGQMIGGMDSDVVVFPELGVAPLVDSGTDLEDELPMTDGSPTTVAVQQGEVALPEIYPTPWAEWIWS